MPQQYILKWTEQSRMPRRMRPRDPRVDPAIPRTWRLDLYPRRKDPSCICLYYNVGVDERLEPDLLDDEDPFEIDSQAAHLFKHPHLGIDDIMEVWASNPLFYPAKPPAHWLMCAQIAGQVLVVPLAPSRSGDVRHCRPIGCYKASVELADQYRRDR